MGKIKTNSRKAVIKTKQKAKQAVNLSVKGAKRAKNVAKKVPQTRVYRKTKKVTKVTHQVVAKKPHERLMDKFPRYNKWHSWQFKKIHASHVHGAVAGAWVLLVVFLVSSSVPTASALSTWTQSDWSGGVGTDTSNQYASIDNLDTTNGSLSINGENAITNGGFEDNLDGWKITGDNSGSFGAKVDYATPNGAKGVTNGDFNIDGNSDVAVANYGTTTVSILLGNGDGSFATKVDYTTGNNPGKVVNGDFNNDSNLDLAVTNYGSSTVSILLGNGDGSFATKVDYSTSYGPAGIVSGFFNGDNKLDLAITNRNSNTISIFLGNGDGSFATKVDYTASTQPVLIESNDINNDGKIDLIVANYGGSSFSVLFGNGDGTFTNKIDYANAGQTTGIGVGDFNGDGYVDVATGRYASIFFQIFINNGDGTFAPRVLYSAGSRPAELSVGDYNGDGSLDILSLSSYSQNVSIILNNGDGSFALSGVYPIVGAYDMAASDVNQDGNPDLLVTNGSNLSVLLNNGDPSYHSTEQAYNSSMHSTKVIATTSEAKYYQNTTALINTHSLTAYAYTDGSAVTVADAQLSVAGNTVTTTYTATAIPGWYKLAASVTGTGSPVKYGVTVKAGKTVYIDDVSLMYYGTSILTSAIKDTDFGSAWDALTYTSSGTGTTEVRVRSSNNSDMSGAPAFAGCPVISSGTDLTTTSCVNDNDRYIQYQVTLIGQNGQTPVLEDIDITYDAFDNTPPNVNASNVIMKKAAGGAVVNAGDWTNGSNPYFEWTAGSDEDTGVDGYCLYLGTTSSADPVTAKGLLGTSPLDTEGACQFAVADTHIDTAVNGYLSNPLSSSNDMYYLNIKAIDKTHNVYSGASEQFNFKLDNTPPKNPEFVTAPSQFVASKEATFTWPTSGQVAPSDSHSGIKGMQYRIGSSGTWYGDAHSGNQDINDLLVNDGSYTTANPPDYDNINEGNNVFYFRTWDNAGNASPVYTTSVLKLNTSSPSSPQNVTANPATNTTNSFEFSWAAPSSFQGSANNLTYCYSINTLPTASACTYTEAGVTTLPAGAYANQPGENTFYVVAKDEAGNINYATAASTTFTANTAAPGIPLDLDIADVSTKATSTWRLALSWNAPTNVGAGVSSYRIYRSINGTDFNQVASTSGTSHVDGGLSAQKYYYRVKACDSANNCGANSSTVNKLPTGKFTSPANITAQPRVTGVSTKKASIRWSTDRTSNSKISLGTKTGEYEPFQVASDKQVTDHTVDLSNLSAGTTYFAKASWTDEDGNVGTSAEFSFKTEDAPLTQEVETRRTTLSSAQIHFTSISAAKVVIQYGLSDGFGGVKEIATSLSKSTYDVELAGLNDGAKYFYRLNTFDADGNEYIGSTVLTFTTPARPRIESLRFQPVENEPTSTQKVTWSTNVPASSLVRFNAVNIPGKEVGDSNLTTEHQITIKDLLDNTEYNFIAESRDKDGNLAVSDTQVLKTALDTRPPKISDVSIETTIRGSGAEARGQIIVSWKTDEPATSQVAYGEGSNITQFNNRSSEDGALSLEHIVIVSDLATSRVYSVKPVSSDNAKNAADGDSQSAIIGRASDDVISIVLNTLKKVFGF